MSLDRKALIAFLALVCFMPRATFAYNSPAPQQMEEKSAAERLTADTSRMTPGGATFKVPAGWSIVTGKNLVILEPPESDTHIAIVNSEAADAKTKNS